ncbi:glycosyltransferase [Acetobacter fabarum]|uniref:glycosyltransferase n=1 Tax=Acetobacter fabarum TaxID=483199 RepID=UPI00312B355F
MIRILAKHSASPPVRKRLRVLHAYKVYLPDVEGGVPSAIHALTVRMMERCQSAILTTRRWRTPRTLKVDNVPVTRTLALMTLRSLPLAPFYPLCLFLRSRMVDVVALHTPFPLADILTALYFRRRCALIVHWHSDVVRQKRLLHLVAPLMRRTLRRADRIIVSNASMITQSPFLRSFADKCEVVPFGTDLTYWPKLNAEEEQKVASLRRTYPHLVVTAGRLVSYKGFDILIKAFSSVNGQCVIVGEGPLDKQLQQQIATLGLQDRVHLVGRLERDALKCMLHAAQVFVLPSVSSAETFGIAQIEAMACGLPVVNTDVPTGVPWVARHEQESLTVAAGQAAPLAQALALLLENAALRQRLGKAGAARAFDLFDEQQFIEKTFRIYEAEALRAQKTGAAQEAFLGSD